MAEVDAEVTQVDLLVVGAGMVGASLLCALKPVIRKQGLKVAVVEAFALPAQESSGQPSYDARSTALSWGSRNILCKTGVWEKLRQGVSPIEHIHVSDKGHFGSVRLNAADYAVEALGYVIENSWLGEVLLEQLREQSGITFLCPATVLDIRPDDEGARIIVEKEGEQTQFQAQLTVIADGGRSGLTHRLGIDVRQREYRQQAIIANVTTQKAHNNVAYERFTPGGPVALLPLREPHLPEGDQRRCALVLTVATDESDAMMALSDAAFLANLQERFGYRLGRFERVGKRYAYPLSLQWMEQPCRPGVVAVGNAAHTLHPVAGQGFNLALRGVDQLAGMLGEAVQSGIKMGDIELLKRYVASRQQDQSKTIGFTDLTVRLFSNNDWLLSRLRDFGLLSLDVLPVGKKLFAQQAMGFSGSRIASVVGEF